MASLPGYGGTLWEQPAPHWSTASGPFEFAPRLVAQPASVDDVIALIRWAGAEGRHLTARGAGTGMPGGNVGRDIVVDLGVGSPFAAIGAVDPIRRRVVCGPGAIAADVDRAARAHGLRLPALPSSAERCTIGGMVANNAAGATSFKHGAVRGRVAALEVVDAQGALHRLSRDRPGDAFARLCAELGLGDAEAWPAVRKNSSGYALDHVARSGSGVDLLVGAEGTLGVVTSVELDVLPMAEARATVLVGVETETALCAWTESARQLELAACEFIGPWLLDKAGVATDPALASVTSGARHVLLLDVEGDASQTLERTSALQALASDRGEPAIVAETESDRSAVWGLRKRASPAIAAAAARGFRSMQFIEDSVVPPASLGTYLQRLAEGLAEVGFEAAVFGHAGDANVHVNPLVPVHAEDWKPRVRRLLESTASLVATLGGTLAGEHGDGRVRAPFLNVIWGDELAQRFTTLKNRLDPQGTLNPGVIVPTPGQDPLEGLGNTGT